MSAFAAKDFNIKNNARNYFHVDGATGNIGIGTTTPQGGLVVLNGNVGIGTWVANRPLNIAIGANSSEVIRLNTAAGNPGGTQGFVYLGFNGTTGAYTYPHSWIGGGEATGGGYQGLLIFSTRTSNSDVVPTEKMRIDLNGNVGVGTSNPNSVLSVLGGGSFGAYATSTSPTGGIITSGNIGIGTLNPLSMFVVAGGGVGIGTNYNSSFIQSTSPAGGLIVEGNVGIGSTAPGTALDVQGTTRTTGLQLSSSPSAGYVLVSGSTGIGTWMAPETISSSAASGWSTGTGTVYNTTGSDKVGIGTTTPQGALVVTNGNVGIGTWAPANLFQIGINQVTVNSVGNLGIGTLTPTGTLEVQGGTAAASTAGKNINIVAQASGAGGNTAGGSITLTSGVGVGTGAGGSVVITTGGGNRPGNITLTTPQAGAAVYGYGNIVLDATGYGGTGHGGYLILQGTNSSGNGGDAILRSGNGVAAFGNPGNVSISAGAAQYNTGGTVTIAGGAGGSTSGVGGDVYISGGAKQGAGTVGNLFLQSSGGNIGVGTFGPGSKLSISGGVGVGTGINTVFVTAAAPAGGMMVEGNVGIGTTTPQAGLVVLGNVGVGTWTADTARLATDGFRLIGNGAAAGNVLVSSSTGIGTWMAPGTISSSAASGWSTGTGTVYTTTGTDNVGIGTSTPQDGLVVTNGNVGIGTWSAEGANLRVIGNVGVGTTNAFMYNAVPVGGMYIEGEVGIGTYSISTGKAHLHVVHKASGSGGVSSIAAFSSYSTSSTTRGVEIGGSSTTFTPVQMFNSNSSSNSLMTMGFTFAQSPLSGAAVQSGLRARYGGSGLLANLEFLTASSERMRIDTAGNVGIGTVSPTSMLVIGGGGVGIGTNFNSAFIQSSSPSGGLIAEGNVGIGTTTPQAGLVVLGNVGVGTWTADTARLATDGFRLIGNGAAAGSVLVSSSTGIGTWMAASTLATSGAASGWTTGTGTVYNTTGSDKVGIGTTTPQGGFVVTNGNVGIGTWAPQALLDVAGTGDAYFTSNLGIGSVNPTQALDVIGTGKFSTGVNAPKLTNLTSNGFVKTGSGDGTLSVDTNTYPSYSSMTTNYLQKATSSSAVGNSSIFDNGNIGIGTTTPQGSFVVTNGNVGIGTWAPDGGLVVMNGNVGIGTRSPQAKFWVRGPDASAASMLTVSSLGNNNDYWSIANGTGSSGFFLPSFFVKSDMTGFGGTGDVSNAYFSVLASPDTTSITKPAMMFDARNYTNTAVLSSRPLFGFGSYNNIYMQMAAGGNLGIGTITAQGKLVVVGGNVGIGTSRPQGALVVTNGNVGIGTWTAEGASLETTGLRLIGNGAAAGSVLVSSSTGIGTWMAASTLATSGAASGWSTGTGTVYNTTGSDNVGIGTTTPQGGFVVANGNVGIGTWTAQSGLTLKSSFAYYRTSTAATATTAGQTIIGVTDTSAARTVHLATGDRAPGRIVIVKDESGGAGTNNITIDGEGGETIDGAASIVISVNYGVLRVYSDGTNWFTF